MSITTAISSAVSGLRAQGAQLAAVAENLANSSTIAFKNREIDFNSLVVGNTTRSGFSGGGVIFRAHQELESQGLLRTTDSATDISLNGRGFFVVSDDTNNQPSGFNFSRNGNFSKDQDGFLVNSEGMFLMGQRTDDTGAIISLASNDLTSVEPVNVGAVAGTAQETTIVRFDLNLPADSATGSTFTNAFQIFDALGIAHQITTQWTKNGPNDWSAVFGTPVQVDTVPPVLSADYLVGGFNVPTAQIDITFNGDGSIATFNPNPPSITLDNFVAGALSPQPITLDLGTIGLTDGVSQFAGTTATPDIEIFFIDQDGVRFGQLSSVEINNEGLVEAIFENGVVLPIYRIPVATFQNPRGLTHINGTIYDEADAAGILVLKRPGQGDAGDIVANSLELSTTDTAEEFNKMIISQQAYAANAQVISTADELFDELLAAVR